MYSLALDNSWLVMDEEEMYDVNGGYKVSNAVFGLAVDAAIVVTAAWMYGTQISALAIKGMRFLKKQFNKLVGLLAKGIGAVAVYFGIALAGSKAALAGLIVGDLSMSLGGLVAMAIDYGQDGRVDGYVRF
jgi:hypothetical protein